MYKRLVSVMVLVIFVFIVQTAAQIPADSEQDIFLPDKKEILSWMTTAAKIPAAQQNEKAEAALKGISDPDDKTPRSNFQLCAGLAYLGNGKAQQCMGRAYENGRGVVDDMLEAYVWFELAAEKKVPEGETDRDRVLLRLNSAYPAPSEEELENLLAEHKGKIAEYQKEAK